MTWERQLDAPYRAHLRRRHLRVLAGLALIPAGPVVLLLIPWQNATDEILWVALFTGFAVAVAIPAAYKTWEGENEPEPLRPGTFQR